MVLKPEDSSVLRKHMCILPIDEYALYLLHDIKAINIAK